MSSRALFEGTEVGLEYYFLKLKQGESSYASGERRAESGEQRPKSGELNLRHEMREKMHL